MSGIDLAPSPVVSARLDRAAADRASYPASAAFGGVAALALFAPFEPLQPLVAIPGQSLSALEALIAASLAVWAAALVYAGAWPQWRTPLTAPWLAGIAIAAAASLFSPASRANALHMTGRLCAAFGIYLLTVNASTSPVRLRRSVAAMLAGAVVVSLLVVLEYARVPAVLDALKAFRPFVVSVGTLVRAGGPLQYPTIASMYLEVAFACGLGLLLWRIDEGRRGAAAFFAALLAIAYAITLTFTRAGLVTMAVSLAIVGAARVRRRNIDRGVAALAALAVAIVVILVASRSASAMWLRFTSEGQEAWYAARIEPPASIALATGAVARVPVTVTNTGRVAWDSRDVSPFFLSYHWMPADGDRYVTYEGIRTPFDAPVEPGATAAVPATVRAPRHPGRYRLVWDIVLEHRLWFSTEPGAAAALSWADVSGPPAAEPLRTVPPPKPTVRPGRLTLWRAALSMFAAHPILGVGPDNYRLAYGAYANLPAADTRVHSNNMYLEVLTGTGLLGAAAFAWLLQAIPKRGMAPFLAAALVAIAVHGLVDSFLSFAPTYVLFSLTLGLAVAMGRGLETRADAHRV